MATSREQEIDSAPQEDDIRPQSSSSQEHHGIGDSDDLPSAPSGEGDPADVFSAHDRDALNDILAHPEGHQWNVEYQLAGDSPGEDPFPELAPSPNPVSPALYAPLSRTTSLPALDQTGSGVAPTHSSPVASSSGRADAAPTAAPAAGAPLFFPCLETSSAHSDSSALLHYSPAAEAETRSYDEWSGRRELAAMMSDPTRQLVDQEVGAGQQQQSVALNAASASDGEAFHRPSSRQETPQDDNAEQSSDTADKNTTSAALDVTQQNPGSTYIHCRDFIVTDGVFVGRRLLISVGKKSQLLVPSEPFDEGIQRLLYICEARQHDLTQLYVEVHQIRVSGGQCDDQDALNAILLSIRAYLPSFNTAAFFFKADDSLPRANANQAEQRGRRSISGSFSRLSHVRIEGMTSAARLPTFPLKALHVLEAFIRITEKDMVSLLKLCSERLAYLAAGPIICSRLNYLPDPKQGSCARSVADKTRSCVMHIKSSFPCEQLLQDIPDNSVVHFTLTDTHGLDKLRAIIGTHSEWTVRLD